MSPSALRESSNHTKDGKAIQDSFKLLSKCIDPLLKFKQRSMLAFTINNDSIKKLKQGFESLIKRLEKGGRTSSAEKTKKAKTKAGEVPTDIQTLAELKHLSQTMSNIELM